MTNEEHIRKNLTTETLASLLIHSYIEDDWDEDMYGDMYVCGSHDVYQASDQHEFVAFEDAVEHEIWWLKQEVKPDG